MKRFLTSIAVVVLSLAVATAAQASKGNNSSSNHNNSNSNGYKPSNTTPTNSNSMKPYSNGQGNGNGQSNKFSNMQKLSPSNTSMNYSKQNSFQKSFGTYYKGKNCNHWTYSCWSGAYGCTCYWDPCCSAYYYFCVPDNCYYPISHCPYGVYAW